MNQKLFIKQILLISKAYLIGIASFVITLQTYPQVSLAQPETPKPPPSPTPEISPSPTPETSPSPTPKIPLVPESETSPSQTTETSPSPTPETPAIPTPETTPSPTPQTTSTSRVALIAVSVTSAVILIFGLLVLVGLLIRKQDIYCFGEENDDYRPFIVSTQEPEPGNLWVQETNTDSATNLSYCQAFTY